MTKAEEKSLEEYPCTKRDPRGIFVQVRREDYIKGYKQAEKDIIDKACEWLRRTQPRAILPDTTIERFRKAMATT